MNDKITRLVEAVKYVDTKQENKPLNNTQMKFEEKLKAKLKECQTPMREAEEDVFKLDTPNTSEEIDEIPGQEDLTNIEELPNEEEEISTNPEELSHIDLTDNVEEVGEGEFTVPAEVHVELVPGAKVRFNHNGVEYIGEVGDLASDSDSVYTLQVTPAEEMTPESEDETENFEDDYLEDENFEDDNLEDEDENFEEAYVPEMSNESSVNKETGIYENFEEGLTMEDINLLESMELTEAGEEETLEEPVNNELSDEQVPTGDIQPPAEENLENGEENLEPGEETSTGEISVGSSLPSGGGSEPSDEMSLEPENAEESEISVSPITEPENVEQLVLELINTESVNKLDELAELHSNDVEDMNEEDLMLESEQLSGTTTLKTEEPKIKVAQKKETTTGKTLKTNTELTSVNTKYTELNNGGKKDTPASTKLNTKEISGAAPKKTGAEHIKDELKGTKNIPEGKEEKGTTKFTNKVSDGGKKEVTNKTDFSKLKQESVQRVALNELSSKYVTLQEEVNKLKLENYKLLKVNGLLTLLPELKIDTREQLVEKFSKCTSSKEVLNLYKKVVGLVKEERKPSLNKLILESKSEPKTLDSISNTDEKRRLTESTNSSELSSEQKRKNSLMGLPGFTDNYYDGVE